MKRSTGVVLVLMGAAAVGGTAYWVSSRDCNNVQPGTSQPDRCRSGSSSSGGTGIHYYGGGSGSQQPSASRTNPPNSAAPATAPAAARGGFGSTSSGFSGGS